MQQDEARALALAFAGFSTLAVGDAVIKTMAGEWPAIAVAALRFGLGAAGLGIALAWREGLASFAMPRPALQWLRGLGMAIATTCFFSAIFVMPLAEATAIFFITPIITAVLSTVVLNEPARRSTWLASAVAFGGVLVVLRPNVAEFGWTAILPLMAACGFSMVVVCNRVVASLASGLAMQFYIALTGAILLTLELIVASLPGIGGMTLDWPSLGVVARCALVACSATLGHWLIYSATTRAGAATIAPMTYLQLLVSIALGWLLFRDAFDLVAMAGAAIIVGAGLFLWRNGKARALADQELP